MKTFKSRGASRIPGLQTLRVEQLLASDVEAANQKRLKRNTAIITAVKPRETRALTLTRAEMNVSRSYQVDDGPSIGP